MGRLGRAAGLAGLGLAVLARPVAAEPAPGCALHRVASLGTVDLPDGRLLVPARIDGQTVALMLDTGAVWSELSPGAAAALRLPVRTLRRQLAFDIAGRPVERGAFGRTLEIGGIEVDHPAFLVPTPAPWEGTSMSGLLGPDLLEPYDLELDPAAGRVNLYNRDHCPGRVVYWSQAYVSAPLRVAHSGHLYLAMSLDGQPVNALIDTGAGTSVLNLDTASRLFGLDPGSPGMERLPDPAPGALPRYRHAFHSLVIEGIEIRNPVLDILPNRARRMHDKAWLGEHPFEDEPNGLPDLLLGMAELSHLHLYIAYGEQRLYATAAEAR